MNVLIAVSDSMNRYPWKWMLKDLKKEENAPSVFSCFSCGGGSSMGYKLAGFNVIGCNEIDPRMMEIYNKNFSPKYKYLMDIRDMLKEKDYPDELLNLDILDGSPPCSVFSIAGRREEGWNSEKVFREGQAMQRLDDLFFAFIELCKRLKPKIIVAENVKGLITGKARGYVHEIVRAFNLGGYDIQIFLLNSAKMGVPQARERVFFIGRRRDLSLPEIKLEFNEEEIPFKDVRSKVGKKIKKDSLQAKLLEHRKPTDRNIADISKRLRRKNAGFSVPICADDRPIPTIKAGGSLFRGVDGLLFTDQDIINCQTFPQDYDFGKESVQYVCGMSVPPVMIANIAEEIKKQLLNR